MKINPEETQCMIIDMQEKLMPAMFNEKECTERAVTLIRGLRVLGIPMMITQQYTKGLGSSIPQIYDAVGSAQYFEKNAFSCARNEAILAELKARNRKNILVCGTETHICTLQTSIDLKTMGFQPVFVTDALASRRKRDKKMGLRRAEQEGILLTTAEAILFELTVDAKNPHFREISAIIK